MAAYRSAGVEERAFLPLPSDTQMCGLSRGTALEVTLGRIGSETTPLRLPTPLGELSQRARATAKLEDSDATSNRDLLVTLMARHGLRVDPQAWWRFEMHSYSSLAPILNAPAADSVRMRAANQLPPTMLVTLKRRSTVESSGILTQLTGSPAVAAPEDMVRGKSEKMGYEYQPRLPTCGAHPSVRRSGSNNSFLNRMLAPARTSAANDEADEEICPSYADGSCCSTLIRALRDLSTSCCNPRTAEGTEFILENVPPPASAARVPDSV